jgi:hypothetical protein
VTTVASDLTTDLTIGAPDLVVLPHARSVFQLLPVVPRVIADMAWELYLSAFAELRTLACQRHVLHRHEFDDTMTDARITKFLGFDGPVLTSLAIRTTDLDAVPLVSPEYFNARYPRQYAARSVYYIGFFAVRVDYQGTGALLELMHALMDGVPADAVVGMDISGVRKSMHLQKAVGRMARTISPTARTVKLDEQSYYAYELSPTD